MKKVNLLSRTEMKNVVGGIQQGGQSCTSSSQCSAGQLCCSDYSDPNATVYNCQTKVAYELPNGTLTVGCASYDPPL